MNLATSRCEAYRIIYGCQAGSTLPVDLIDHRVAMVLLIPLTQPAFALRKSSPSDQERQRGRQHRTHEPG
jgi:hypothetical protein